MPLGRRGWRPAGRSWRRCGHGALGPVDLDHPLTPVGREAGQAGAVAAGALQRPTAPPRRALGHKARKTSEPAWSLGIMRSATRPPFGFMMAAAWLSRWVSTPMTWSTLPSRMAWRLSSSKTGDRGRHRPGMESPRDRTVRVTTQQVGQASDQVSDVVGQAGAGSLRAFRVEGTSQTAGDEWATRAASISLHAMPPADQPPLLGRPVTIRATLLASTHLAPTRAGTTRAASQ
jgi:hypothetical protein